MKLLLHDERSLILNQVLPFHQLFHCYKCLYGQEPPDGKALSWDGMFSSAWGLLPHLLPVRAEGPPPVLHLKSLNYRVNDRPPRPSYRIRIAGSNSLQSATAHLRRDGDFRLPISASQPTNWPSRSCLELVWRMIPNSRLTISVRGPGCPVTNELISDGF